jgi:hypothetical protein
MRKSDTFEIIAFNDAPKLLKIDIGRNGRFVALMILLKLQSAFFDDVHATCHHVKLLFLFFKKGGEMQIYIKETHFLAFDRRIGIAFLMVPIKKTTKIKRMEEEEEEKEGRRKKLAVTDS